MAKVILVDGQVTDVTPANGSNFTAEEIHNLLHGYFEMVPLKNNMMLLCDEEGKLKQLDYNTVATNIAKTFCLYKFDDYIAGPAMLCTDFEVK